MSEQALWAAPTALSLSSTGRLGLMSVDDKQHRKQVVGEKDAHRFPQSSFSPLITRRPSLPYHCGGGEAVLALQTAQLASP